MYYKGQGVEQDDKEAFKWWKKAAEPGNANAQVNLGAMYADGKGVTKDYVKAYKWFCLAAAQDSKYTEWRDKLETEMSKEQIAESQKISV